MTELPYAKTGERNALMQLLRCPTCKAELESDTTLFCRNGHTFTSEDGIPVLIGPESPDEEHQHSHQKTHYDREYGGYRSYQLENWQRVYISRVARVWSGVGLANPFVDVGTGGSAYTVIEAARAGVTAVGCDISVDGMKTARRLADAEGVGERCLFVACRSEQLPFADGSFAGAAAIAVLEHVPNDLRAISEIARVTRKGGQVFLAAPNSLESMPRLLRPLYARHDRRIGHLRHYSASELAKKCGEAGLQSRSVVYSAHWSKVWQLALHLAASRLRINDTKMWWWLEGLDARAAAADNGMHLNMWLQRDV